MGRRVDGHFITPLLRLGRLMGNLRTHSSSLLMPFYAHLGATEVFLETGMGTCAVCWCFGKNLIPKAPALASY